MKNKHKNQRTVITVLLLLSFMIGQQAIRRHFHIPCRSPIGGTAEGEQIVLNLLETHGGLPKTRINTLDLGHGKVPTYPVHHWEIAEVTARGHTDWGGIDDPWYLEPEHRYSIFVDVEFEDGDTTTLRMGGKRSGFVVCPFIPRPYDVRFFGPMGISVESHK